MKDKILLVYTGGTICSFLDDNVRSLDVGKARSVITDNFSRSGSEYASLSDSLFEDSGLTIGTLSENMTIGKLSAIIENIRLFDLNNYAGVIVLHGTDTLAYTAAMFSLVFADIPIPMMMVSANRPPMDPATNANENFRTAVDLIMGDIAPNVYVPYRNSDGGTYIHIASSLMQCPNFSEDFYNATNAHVFSDSDMDEAFEKCKYFSEIRKSVNLSGRLSNSSVLLLYPYPGLDYSRIDLSGIKAIVHGTYHSGTVCVERCSSADGYSTNSILHLADMCHKTNIPVYIAPSALDAEQYSSVHDAANNGGIVPLRMTVEAAYAKAIIGTSLGHTGNGLTSFMNTDIACEIVL